MIKTYWQVTTTISEVEEWIGPAGIIIPGYTETFITSAIEVFPSDISPEYLEANNIRTVLIKPGTLIDMGWSGNNLVPILTNHNEPQWQEYMNACDVSDRGGNGLFALALTVNFPIASIINERLNTIVRNNIYEQSDIAWLTYLYTLISPMMTLDQKKLLVDTLRQYNIPIQLES